MLQRMMVERLHRQSTFEDAISTILSDVVALHGAEFGDFQLPIGDWLVIVAQHGLSAPFLEAFKQVRMDHGTACGRALSERRTVVIPDVEQDAQYAPFRSVAAAAGYRGVQSTPLFTWDGEFMGMVSTLFARPHEPTAIEMETLNLYSVRAADHLVKLLKGESLKSKVTKMHNRLYAEFGMLVG